MKNKKILAVLTAVLLAAASVFSSLGASAEEGILTASGGDIASGGDVEESTEESTEAPEESTEESTEAPEESTEESTEAPEESTEESTEAPEESTEESTETPVESTESSASEEEKFEEAKTDQVAAVTENGETLTVVAVDLTKYDAEKADNLTQTIDEEAAPGDVAAFFEVKVEGMAGTIVLTFKVDGVKASDDVMIVHWLTDDQGNETGEVEYIKPEAVRDGEIDAKFTSLSPIAVVVNRASDAQPEDNPAPAETEVPAVDAAGSPATGDAGYGVSLAVCVIALCGTLIAMMLKRKTAR